MLNVLKLLTETMFNKNIALGILFIIIIVLWESYPSLHEIYEDNNDNYPFYVVDSQIKLLKRPEDIVNKTIQSKKNNDYAYLAALHVLCMDKDKRLIELTTISEFVRICRISS